MSKEAETPTHVFGRGKSLLKMGWARNDRLAEYGAVPFIQGALTYL